MAPLSLRAALLLSGCGTWAAGCGARTGLSDPAALGAAGAAGSPLAAAGRGGRGGGGEGGGPGDGPGGGPDGGHAGAGPLPSPLAPRPLSPLSSAQVTSSTPTLRWQLPTGADGALVELFQDRACTRKLAAFVAEGASGRPPSALPAGVAYWRLKGRRAGATGEATSPVWQFRVGHRSTPVDTSWGTTLDVNGDGLDDVLVGAPFGGVKGAGEALLFLGAAAGAPPAAAGTLADPTRSFFGSALTAAGDVNGDGFVDVLVGATNASAPPERDSASLYLGGPGGLASHADALLAAPADAGFGQTGVTRAVGDLNGDGYGDVVVGAYLADNNTGKAYVFLGGPAGLALSPFDTIAAPLANGQFGQLVASAGDVNGDGFADVLIAGALPAVYLYLGGKGGLAKAPGAVLKLPLAAVPGAIVADDINGDGFADVIVDGFTTGQAVVYVYAGGPSGLSLVPSAIPAPDPSLQFGLLALGTGDFNGDGFADLVVGGASHAPSPTGKAYLYPGSALGLPTSAGAILVPAAPHPGFGGSVSSRGDMDGDGFSDVVIGADNAASLYRGGPGGLSSSSVVSLGTLPTATGYQLAMAEVSRRPVSRELPPFAGPTSAPVGRPRRAQ